MLWHNVKLLADNGQLLATISNKNSSDHSRKIEPKDCLVGRECLGYHLSGHGVLLGFKIMFGFCSGMEKKKTKGNLNKNLPSSSGAGPWTYNNLHGHMSGACTISTTMLLCRRTSEVVWLGITKKNYNRKYPKFQFVKINK
jgi:hypothetical protein